MRQVSCQNPFPLKIYQHTNSHNYLTVSPLKAVQGDRIREVRFNDLVQPVRGRSPRKPVPINISRDRFLSSTTYSSSIPGITNLKHVRTLWKRIAHIMNYLVNFIMSSLCWFLMTDSHSYQTAIYTSVPTYSGSANSAERTCRWPHLWQMAKSHHQSFHTCEREHRF